MSKTVKIVGMEKLQKKLKKNVRLDDVKRVVRHNGAEMQEKAQRNAPVDTGTLKRSIVLEMKDEGLTAEVGPTVEYGEYVEFGTRPMEAQPYVGPAFNEQKEKFKKDMKKLTK